MLFRGFLPFGGQLHERPGISRQCLAVLQRTPVLGESTRGSPSRQGEALGEYVQQVPEGGIDRLLSSPVYGPEFGFPTQSVVRVFRALFSLLLRPVLIIVRCG